MKTFIKSLSQISLNDNQVVGGKNASLDEMYSKQINMVKGGWKNEYSSLIVIISEGDETDAAEVVRQLKQIDETFDIRVTVLGHVQRGNPSYADRLLGAKMGNSAVKALLRNETDKMVGVSGNQIILTAFENVAKQHTIDKDMFDLMELLT